MVDGEEAEAAGHLEVDARVLHMQDQILVVDDEAAVRELVCSQVRSLGFECSPAKGGKQALQISRQSPRPSLVLADVRMPGLDGEELLAELKRLDEHIQVVMISGSRDLDTVRRCMREGAYDYLLKPFDMETLENTIRRALERYHLLSENQRYRSNLEHMVLEQTEEIRQTRDTALLILAKLAESRDNDTGLHLERMSAYSLRLAEALSKGPYSTLVTREFIQQLHKSSPLHDIGKVGIPDTILLKPGPLTQEEFEIMKTHCAIGGDTLRTGITGGSDAQGFLRMGMEIAYSHHERWDGQGYPSRIATTAIPLAARIVALADSYDALTSDRPYKQATTHLEAVRRIAADRGSHFDPIVVDAFLDCQQEFSDIRQQVNSIPAG